MSRRISVHLAQTLLWGLCGCNGKVDCAEDAYSLDPECLAADDTSSSDSADTGDTEEPDSDLVGTLEMDVVMTDMGGLEDHCTGVLTVQYDEAAVGRELGGTFDCTWETPMGEQLAGAVGEGIIDGGFDGEGLISGTAWYGPIEAPWSGSVDEKGLLTGTWSGHQDAIEEFGLPALDHSGLFEVQLP